MLLGAFTVLIAAACATAQKVNTQYAHSLMSLRNKVRLHLASDWILLCEHSLTGMYKCHGKDPVQDRG
jgi:hypothetical protein